MNNVINCPNCGKTIKIGDVLKEEIEKEYALKHKKEIEDVKRQTEEKIREELSQKSLLEISDLKKSLEEKEKKLVFMREEELRLREQKRNLEEKEKEFELTFQRKLDEERKKVEETVMKHASDEFRLKDMEKEKVISDLKHALEDAQRKASQGSQQTQGEILELDLENTLRNAFPQDIIEPVEKGIRGADLRQIVKSPMGAICGVILWESKRTKAWTDEWLMKLKDDLRAEKADIPVIVSTTLPKEAEKGFGLKEGVWIVSYGLFLPVAIILRKSLFDIARQKALSANQGRKADLLYEFITGNEFKQQIEAIVEVYQEMNEQISKEKIAFEKIWKNREGQLKRLITGTINVYAGAQGLVGKSMPQIKGLDLLEISEENPKQESQMKMEEV